MAEINLVEILAKAETLPEAFSKMKGMEIMENSDLKSSYVPVSVRREFVILEENDGDKRQFLHPYGTSVLYFVHNEHPKRDASS